MAVPDHTPLGARLRERTQPLAPDDASYGYAHAHLCEALGRMLAQVGEVFDPEGDVPPLAPILDPDLCPAWALDWLGQLVGVRLPAGLDEASSRAMIKSAAGFARGTPAAMEAALATVLTGTKTVYFRERDASDPYRFEVVTLTSETPDPVRAEAILRAAKPGGLVLSYRTVASWDWQQVTTEQASWNTAKAAYTTWRKFVERTPG
jgi:hypothetical protein